MEWVLEFYKLTGEAPGQALQDVYFKKRKFLRDENEEDLIASFMTNLANRYDAGTAEVSNEKYAEENALEYLKLRSFALLSKKMEDALKRHSIEDCEAVLLNHRRVERIEGSMINVFNNPIALNNAKNKRLEFLYKLPGKFGSSVGVMHRTDFAMMGSASTKKGKSFVLGYHAIHAMLAGLKVVIFNLEMSEEEGLMRSFKMFSGEPDKPKKVKLPSFVEREDGTFDIEYKNVQKDGIPSSVDDFKEYLNKYAPYIRDGQLWLGTYPAGSMTMDDCIQELDKLEAYYNVVPDVILFDYLGIIKPPYGEKNKRLQMDAIYQRARALAQERNCLVGTVAQASKDAAKGDADETNIAEAYAILSHCTTATFLSQTPEEKKLGIMRASTSIRRDGATSADQVILLQGLDISSPVLASQWRSKVNIPEIDGIDEEFGGVTTKYGFK